MRRTRNVVVAVTALMMIPWAPLAGQDGESEYGGQLRQFDEWWSLTPYQYNLVTVRPRNQPLIPLFEGWAPPRPPIQGVIARHVAGLARLLLGCSRWVVL